MFWKCYFSANMAIVCFIYFWILNPRFLHKNCNLSSKLTALIIMVTGKQAAGVEVLLSLIQSSPKTRIIILFSYRKTIKQGCNIDSCNNSVLSLDLIRDTNNIGALGQENATQLKLCCFLHRLNFCVQSFLQDIRNMNGVLWMEGICDFLKSPYAFIRKKEPCKIFRGAFSCSKPDIK